MWSGAWSENRKYFTHLCLFVSLCISECHQIIVGSFNDFIRLFNRTENETEGRLDGMQRENQLNIISGQSGGGI